MNHKIDQASRQGPATPKKPTQPTQPTTPTQPANRTEQQSSPTTPDALEAKAPVTSAPKKTNLQKLTTPRESRTDLSMRRMHLNPSLEHGIRAPAFSASNVHPVLESPDTISRKVANLLPGFINSYNYDRICYLGELYDHCRDKGYLSNPKDIPTGLFDDFSARSKIIIDTHKGGHCAALALKFKDRLPSDLKNASFLAAGEIKHSLKIRGGPKFNHSALLIKFTNPNDHEEQGFILADPSFDFSHAPYVSNKRNYTFPYSMTGKDEEWHYSLSEDCKSIICQPQPTNSTQDWRPSEADLKKRTVYRTDQLINPESSITHPIMAKDSRPVIVSRDCDEPAIGLIAISFTRKIVSIRIDEKIKEFSFSDILSHGIDDHSWIEGSKELLTATFKTSSDILIEKVAKAVHVDYIISQTRSSINLPTI